MDEVRPKDSKPTSSKQANQRLTLGLLNPATLGSSPTLLWNGVAQAARNRDANFISFNGRILDLPHDFDAQGNILYHWITPETVDGTITVTSVPDQGTTFTIRLPVRQGRREAEQL